MQLWKYAVGEEVWKGAAGVQTLRWRGMEIRSSGGMLRAWIYERFGGALQACCLYLPQESRSFRGALQA